ncbi:hypothetical protein ASA1KI_26610 [Opitutales bacterium ASA1]|uniref:MarR family winged helix-turn-helix transcriptional regulator n=1 Tax=Congregicoccus parvus TaxID=3081749 RepID=UPI002B2CCC0B|nr:hypothetical protein ASA1KI_26610 [Opitutales bacterium ASA1]
MNRELAIGLVVQTLRTSSALLRESRRLFRPLGLTEAQFNVLNLLAAAKDGMTQSELGEVLVVDRSNVTGLVDRMERAGWVKRGDVPGDRRAHRVVLTAKGRRLWDKAADLYEAAVLEAARAVGDAQARAGVEAMRRLEAAAVVIGERADGGGHPKGKA